MLAVLFFPFHVALGSVPKAQTVNNPVTDFNAVAQLDRSVAGTNGRGVGTGSIVMKFVGKNGGDYVCALTADHVVSGPGLTGSPLPNKANAIGFGNSVAATTGAATQYKIVGSSVGGPTKKEDIAMELVRVGTGADPTVAPGLKFSAIDPLTPVSLNNGQPAAGTKFTTMGFGNTGTLNAATPSYTETLGTYGTKRFGNNITTGTVVPFTKTYNGAM